MFAYDSEAARSNEVFSWESIYVESKATSLLKSCLLLRPQGGDNASVPQLERQAGLSLLFLVALQSMPRGGSPLGVLIKRSPAGTGLGVSSHGLGEWQGAMWE